MRSAFWSIVFILALGACGSKAPANGGDSGDGDEQWVCQPDDDRWECEQGDEPTPPAPAEQAPADPDHPAASDSAEVSQDTAETPESADAQIDTLAPDSEETTPATPVAEADSEDTGAEFTKPDQSEMVQALLAGGLVDIMDLPPEHWTVQLIAVKEEANLKRHAEKLGLDDLPSARIANGGQLYHVLLLGFYTSRESAEEAVAKADLPTDGQQVYFRSVDSLQDAIKAGNDLALTGS